MFRGQLENWPLLPSIGRYPTVALTYENWQVFHDYIIERFIRLARPYFQHEPTSDADWWVHAQHYGCPTRLLDWTRHRKSWDTELVRSFRRNSTPVCWLRKVVFCFTRCRTTRRP
jgi:hypothetical protein